MAEGPTLITQNLWGGRHPLLPEELRDVLRQGAYRRDTFWIFGHSFQQWLHNLRIVLQVVHCFLKRLRCCNWCLVILRLFQKDPPIGPHPLPQGRKLIPSHSQRPQVGDFILRRCPRSCWHCGRHAAPPAFHKSWVQELLKAKLQQNKIHRKIVKDHWSFTIFSSSSTWPPTLGMSWLETNLSKKKLVGIVPYHFFLLCKLHVYSPSGPITPTAFDKMRNANFSFFQTPGSNPWTLSLTFENKNKPEAPAPPHESPKSNMAANWKNQTLRLVPIMPNFQK